MRTMVPLRSIIRKGSATFHGCEKMGVYRIHVPHTPPRRAALPELSMQCSLS
jgi:hypothetical protein